MDYEIIQPPFTLRFREMSKQELRAYFAWFLDSIRSRVQILERAVRSTPGYEGWKADYSPESLGPLGDWFTAQVESRPLTEREIAEIRSEQRFPVGVPESDLTNRTFSLAMDIAMYLGQMIVNDHPSLAWKQPIGGKRTPDHGEAVIAGFPDRNLPTFNPVRALRGQAYDVVRRSEKVRLREIYDRVAERVAGRGAGGASGRAATQCS